MKRNLITLLLVAALGAAGYYCYQNGCMKKAEVVVEAKMEEALTAICDPAKEDCSALEEDLEL